MHIFSTLSGAAVLLALTSSVQAAGTASISNQCGTEVYYKTVSTSEKAFQSIPESGVQVPYTLPGQGVSIKLSLTNDASGPISQFEFTWADGKINYDLSNIDGDPNSPEGYPFAKGGMTVTPSMSDDPENPTCIQIDCPAGSLVCTQAYNAPNDPRTMVCNQDADLSLVLCPRGSGNSSKRDTHTHGHRRHIGHPHARR